MPVHCGNQLPLVIQIDGINLSLDTSTMVSLCVTNPGDRLAAYLRFVLDDRGCGSALSLGGKKQSDRQRIETVVVASAAHIGPEGFLTIIDNDTVDKSASIRLAFGDKTALKDLRDDLVAKFHRSVAELQVAAVCRWDNFSLRVTVSIQRSGVELANLMFYFPAEEAGKVIRDRRRQRA